MRNIKWKYLWLFLYLFLIHENIICQNHIFYADSTLEDSLENNIDKWDNIRINEISSASISGVPDEYGDFDDWIELYNFSDEAINLNGLYISDSPKNLAKYQISSDTFIPPNGYIIIWADEEPYQGPLHTSFKLDIYGESVYISSNADRIIDNITFPNLITGLSYGRLRNDFLTWNIFNIPSPGEPNPDKGCIEMLKTPTSGYPSGYYSDSLLLELRINDPDAESIFYTLNGEDPTINSNEYTTPITINKTSTIRYRSFGNPNFIPSKTVSQTFIFNDSLLLDAISIVGSQSAISLLFSQKTKGVELPVHIDYFGCDHVLKFSIDGGFQLHSPKANKQLSFRLYARSDYGYNSMDYQVFKNKDICSFKRLILRNGGNDGTVLNNNYSSHIRDGLHHILFHDMGHSKETSAYKPVNVYINGTYYGIYNIRERIDKYFVESNFGYIGEMDLLERAFKYPGNKNAIEGSFEQFDILMSYINNNDLAVDSNYIYIAKNYDINQYTDYWIHEIFIGNVDWMLNNIKIYRPNVSEEKFMWILWDTDHGSGLPYLFYGNPNWASLTWSLSTDQLRTEGGGTTILQRGLIQNKKYKQFFINRYADLLNTTYEYSNVTFKVDSLKDIVLNDMSAHIKKWNLKYLNWINAIDKIKMYHSERAEYVRNDIKTRLGLDGYFTTTLEVNNQEQGAVKINTIVPKMINNKWSGVYFSNVPIVIEAIPKPGYKFSHWLLNSSSLACRTIDSITCDTTFMAYFTPLIDDSTQVFINEIKNAWSIDPDGDNFCWVEIYNGSSNNISLNNWRIVTPDDTIVIPNYNLAGNNYLVISNKNAANFPSYTKSVLSDNNFEIINGECILLYNNKNELIDSVEIPFIFESNLPVAMPFSIELIDFKCDNSTKDNWKASTYLGGTPGKENSLINKGLLNLVINEIMAQNNSVILDNFYENDDWIEIYNKSDNQVNLNGLFISDDKENPVKYQIHEGIEDLLVDPYGYEILWADNDTDQGALHLNFKLANEGESLRLYRNTGYKMQLIDEIKFPQQKYGWSYGSIYDGINTEMNDLAFLNPTPEMSNIELPTGLKTHLNNRLEITVYPNPTENILYINSSKLSNIEQFTIVLYNMIGDIQKSFSVNNKSDIIKIDLSDLKSGVYILKVSGFSSCFKILKR
ncbi:MAG: lamin tail domain-containing protein [Marinilabiliaceae bacterium]|nr:lamin tail domain-containing protein [Marinilabiliaceae bacterium]